MEELVANFILEEQPGINANLSLNVTNTEHDLLSHRDYPDQHPITAITGLQEALDTIPTDYVSDAELESALLEKQDTLTAGANIQIVGNTISATDTKYTAGTGISIVGNVISTIQTSAEWGYITGTLSAQTDLQNALNAKANVADIPTATSDLLNDSGFITNTALSGYATQTWVSQQGYLTEIPAEYITDSELTAKGYQTAADVETAITAKGYTTMSAVEAKGYITNAALVGYATESYVTTAVGTETTNRQNADNNLQSQIDAITASSDVTDIVGTYAELQSYDTSTLPPNSIIKVLQDESRNNETTYYRWVITGGVGAWSLIGEEGPYYTMSAADAKFATQTALSTGLSGKQDTISDLATIRSGAALGATAVQPSDLATVATSGSYNDLSNKPTIPAVNNATLTITQGGTTKGTFTANASSNVTIDLDSGGGTGNVDSVNGYTGVVVLTASDVGALPDSTTIPTVNNATLTIQKNGTDVQTFTANASSDVTANITVPTDTSDLTNTAGFITGITSTDVTNALGYTPYNNTNPSGYITSSALSGYATETWVGQQGYITGITSSDVTTALGYTPYNSSNPNGYITSSALTGYATESYVTTATANMQTTGNLVTSISSSSTNTQYPSAKCVYDIVGDIESAINTIRGV